LATGVGLEPGLGFPFGATANTAVTALGETVFTAQAPRPLQPPAQRTSWKPPFSFGTSLTRVPDAKVAVHRRGHEIPAGVLTTVAPLPRTTTVRGARPLGCDTAAPASVNAAATAQTSTATKPALLADEWTGPVIERDTPFDCFQRGVLREPAVTTQLGTNDSRRSGVCHRVARSGPQTSDHTIVTQRKARRRCYPFGQAFAVAIDRNADGVRGLPTRYGEEGNAAMPNSFLSILVIGLLAATVTLTGCGGSSGGGGSASETNGGKHAITARECQSIRSVFDDLESFVAGTGLDYVNDAATVDRLGSTIAFPDTVSDSYKTWQDAIDKIASTMKDVGVKPNDTPLPAQLDELNSKFHESDSLNKAGGTVNTWVSNGCD
jgi:hypothetical protein